MKKRKTTGQQSTLTADVVRAREIVLVDEFGKERARLMCSGGDGGLGGHTVIRINDDAGRPRLELQVDLSGPSIRLSTPNDGTGMGFSVNEKVGNGLVIGDHNGLPSVTFGVPHPDSKSPIKHPDITILDRQSGRGWTATSGTYAFPSEEVRAKQDAARTKP